MDRMLAQAMPTPTMERSSRYLSWMNATERRPAAPASRHSVCAFLRPSRAASFGGRASENAKQTAEYIAKQSPPHSTPAR